MLTASVSELTWQSALFAASSGAGPDPRPRLSPRAAYQEVLWQRATLVDIRPDALRATEGSPARELTPLVIDRHELAARLDPRSPSRLPIAAPGLRVIVLCQDGNASRHAANTLGNLGIRRATDMVGGFAAWRSVGLPIAA